MFPNITIVSVWKRSKLLLTRCVQDHADESGSI
jgi:hypothetical protein